MHFRAKRKFEGKKREAAEQCQEQVLPRAKGRKKVRDSLQLACYSHAHTHGVL